jgi:ATP-dependent 26S proteasome regulatory subunit
MLGLKPFDLEALLVCLAPALDVRYERLYGYLQDDVTRKRPSINLVLDLFAPPGGERLRYLARFDEDAPLMRYRLLERLPDGARGTLLSQALVPDDAIVAWLLGHYQPPAELREALTLRNPTPSPLDLVLAEKPFEELRPHLEEGDGLPPLVMLSGIERSSQSALARLLAAELHQPLLTIDLDLATALATHPPLKLLVLAFREARLLNAVPYLTHWEKILGDHETPPHAVLDEVFNYPNWVIVASEKEWLLRGFERARRVWRWAFPAPAYPARQRLWPHFLPDAERSTGGALEALAAQFLLTTEQIRDAVETARDFAAQQRRALQATDLFTAARLHSNAHLSGLARKLKPRYAWDDLILPMDQLAILREIVATVRRRPLVLEEWGVGQKLAASAGVTVLFAGSPGTGKTMAAEVITAQLGLDLYKIDLSSLVSKYIGETEKNLERIFTEAQASNAILFFDEADAIFGKRSEVKDAHDRYANVEVSYLLQRMEAYDGVTILATNLRANLDDAFTRRLQFAIDFPFPDEPDRLRIWQTLFPPGVPRAPDLDLPLLAKRYKLAGGNIRNIIVGAAYLAAAEEDGPRAVTMAHLWHSLRRELQKMGRLVRDGEMA